MSDSYRCVMRLGHQRGLDGYRAFAILGVLLLHLNPRFHGGFIGVDMFFALSGFLITSLLLEEHAATGTISRRAFYLRRALRLGPALAVTLLLATGLELLTGPFDGASHFPLVVLGTLLYATNWINALGPAAMTGYLGHSWSLAIEEQFYLIWPVLLLVPTLRRKLPSVLPWLIGGIICARLAAWLLTGHTLVADWTPLRADGLMLGALAAYLLRSGHPVVRWCSTRAAGWLSAAGLLVLFLALSADSKALFYGGYALVPLLGSVLILHVVTADGWWRSLMSWGPLVALGRVSYGVYLFNYPICHAVQHYGLAKPVEYGVELVAIAALTVGSWFLVERPALRLKQRLGNFGRGDVLDEQRPGGRCGHQHHVVAVAHGGGLH